MSCQPHILGAFLALTIWSTAAFAQQESEPLSAVPSRPNFTNSTDTVPAGKLQLEMGVSRQWFGGGEFGGALTGAYGFGLARNVDVRWTSDHLVSASSGDWKHRSGGDNWVGVRYRISEQGQHRPSVGLMYQVKVPTADRTEGLGSGFVDHSFALLFSKDFAGTRADANLVRLLLGSESGWKQSTLASLALSRVVRGRLGGMLEAYGGRSQEGSGQASMLAALTWRWGNRLGSDAGVEFGLTPGVPRKRLVMGMTYLISRSPWKYGKQAAAMVRH